MQELIENASAVFLSVALHAALAALLVFGLEWEGFRVKPEIRKPAIQATVVNMEAILAQRKERADEKARVVREAEAAADRKRREETRKRQLAAIEDRKARQADADKKKQREQELIRQQEEQLEELRRRREAAEEDRRQEEERLANIREQQIADQKERELEEERRRLRELLQAESDQIADAQATLREEYLYAIQALVTSNWRRPPTAQEGLSCNMLVRQIPGGEVLAVAVTSPCNADAPTRESIIRAINASSPLPSRGYEAVFAREIKFTFRYDG